jgi:protein gp37
MSDLFHEALAFEDIAAIFGVMAAAPQHTFQVLTKRAGRMLEFFEWIKAKGDERNPFDKTRTTERMAALMAKFDWVNQEEKCGPWPLPNVWLGVSAEDQDTLRDRAWKLLKVPAAVRFVSLEPLLGAVDLDEPELLCRTWRRGATIGTYLDWVIVGGESGPHARPMNPDWVRSLRDQCATAEIPFLFKQWGEFCAPDQLPDPVFREWDAIENAAGHPDIDRPLRFGKKTTGRLLDGALHDGYPKPLTQASA